MLFALLTTLPCQLITKQPPGGSRKEIEVISVTGGTTAIEKGFNQTGRGPASPLLRPSPLWRHLIQSIQPLVELHGKQARIFYSTTAIFLQSYVYNFGMMSQKTHSLAQGPSHLATLVIGAQRSHQGFLTPWPAIPSLSSSPSLAEKGLLPPPLFVARLRFFLRLLLRASPPMTPHGIV